MMLIDLRNLRQDVVFRSRSVTLKAIAGEVRRTSHIFVTSGSNRLMPDEDLARRTAIESLADEIDRLAHEAVQGSGSYRKFDAILRQLHQCGRFPEGPAVAAVAAAFSLRNSQ